MQHKKIIIFGSDGFIGKNLKNHFENSINPTQNPNNEYIFLTREKIDLTNKASLKNYMQWKRPDIVINAAGNIGSSLSNNVKNEYNIFKENVIILMNLFECCEETKVEKLILFSTYRLFDNEVRENYDETDIGKGSVQNNRGYLESKKVQNVLMEFILKNSFTKIVCLIMTNVFGEEDKFILNGRIVPSLIVKVMEAKKNNKNLFIDGHPEKEVNLIYVKDIVKMVEDIIRVEMDQSIGNILVFNQRGTMKIGELAEKIVQKMDYQGAIEWNNDAEYERTNSMKPNLSKMEAFFPDFTFTRIEEAIRKTIESFETNESRCL